MRRLFLSFNLILLEGELLGFRLFAFEHRLKLILYLNVLGSNCLNLVMFSLRLLFELAYTLLELGTSVLIVEASYLVHFVFSIFWVNFTFIGSNIWPLLPQPHFSVCSFKTPFTWAMCRIFDRFYPFMLAGAMNV